MSAPLIVSICITLWASALWFSLPKARQLQRPLGLKALKTQAKTYFQPGFVAKAASLFMALVKIKFL